MHLNFFKFSTQYFFIYPRLKISQKGLFLIEYFRMNSGWEHIKLYFFLFNFCKWIKDKPPKCALFGLTNYYFQCTLITNTQWWYLGGASLWSAVGGSCWCNTEIESVCIQHNRTVLTDKAPQNKERIEMWIEVLLIFLTCCAFFVWKLKKNGRYWIENGVANLKMDVFGGSVGMFDMILKKKHILDCMREHYHMFPEEKIYGIFSFMKPALVIKDPEIVRQIFVKDFNSFTDRDPAKRLDTTFGENRDIDTYWKHQLTSLNGNKWKDVRSTFSPVFTSGKMKLMMKFIRAISERLVKQFIPF